MNLNTTYLGLELLHPLIAGASPLADNLDDARRLEDVGAAAIVMRSLFQEQVEHEHDASVLQMEMHSHQFAEATSFFPNLGELRFGPHEYVEHLGRLKKAMNIPVIGSLNGLSDSGWLEYAQLIEQAGADALELNVYHVATDPSETSAEVERRVVDVATRVREAVAIPVAVKLSPFFTSVPNLVQQLTAVGINGVVLFNRFYQPEIDLQTLTVMPRLHLSDSSELLLRVRWLAILAGHFNISLAASGGVHTVTDVLKAIMAGAHAVQVVSALLSRGTGYMKFLLEDLKQWMVENDYQSIRQMQGSLSLNRCDDPAAFERGNYMRILHSWRGGSR
jgi:dihydroorotate dehydrogenase (fumarate)